MAEDVISPREFGTAFKGFLDQSVAHAEAPDPPLRVRLRAHFATDPAVLPVVGEQFEGYDDANVQLAIDSWLGTERRAAELVGVRSGPFSRPLGLADLRSSRAWAAGFLKRSTGRPNESLCPWASRRR